MAFQELRGLAGIEQVQINKIRQAHRDLQLSNLWEMEIDPLEIEDTSKITLLLSKVILPGVEIESRPLPIGNVQIHFQGRAKTGGLVSLTFVEDEEGTVDKFLRKWFTPAEAEEERRNGLPNWLRYSKSPKDGVRRDATLTRRTRAGKIATQYFVKSLTPKSYKPVEFSYDKAGAVLLQADFNCDVVVTSNSP